MLGWVGLGGELAAAQTDPIPRISTSINEVEALQTARCEDYLRARQWEDALSALDDLVEQSADRWVQIDATPSERGDFELYVSAREYANRQLAFAPQELLTFYRRQVDPVAERWWQVEGAERVGSLQRIVERMPLGTRGDAAILALADHFLEVGYFHRARYLIERLLPSSRLPLDFDSESPLYSGGPIWLWMRQAEADNLDTAEVFDPEFNRQNAPLSIARTDRTNEADLWARLVWLAVMTKQYERARYELEILRQRFPESEGNLFGKEGRWVDLLAEEIQQASTRSTIATVRATWPTLGGSASRMTHSAWLDDLPGMPTWSVNLPEIDLQGERLFADQTRLSDADRAAVAYHPVVWGGTVAWCQEDYVRALRIEDGSARWPLGEDIDTDPELRGMIASTERDSQDSKQPEEHVGVPRFTSFIADGQLFARLGNPVTASRDAERRDFGQVWGIDLKQNASLLPGFIMQSEDPAFEFDGCPIADEAHWYSVLRRTSPDSARVTVSVVCYERLTVPPFETPQPKWRLELCDAEMPELALGSLCTHTLLTLAEGVLFINTNAGVVAAVDAEQGRALWLLKYPRTAWSERAENEHYQRDLNPCVVRDDQVIVAPSDSGDVFVLDRATGQLVWNLHLPRAQYLLGLNDDTLVFGGGQVSWVDRRLGRLLTTFPTGTLASSSNAAHPVPRGLGRGTMAGDRLYWSSREQLFVFQISPAKSRGADGRVWYRPLAERVIDLEPRGVTGGNLVIVDSTLLIAGTNRLWAFRLPWSNLSTE